MTRYARADGSKGSNKRVRADPTPWSELKPKKQKTLMEPVEAKEEISNSLISEEISTVPKAKKMHKSKNKKLLSKNVLAVHPQTEEDFKGNFQAEPIVDSEDESKEIIKTDTETKDIKKITKKSKKKKNTAETNVDKRHGFITENGNRYKVFKSGVKKPWLDIPYEENEFMTLYDKFFVKREAVEELNNFKDTLQGLSEKVIKGKMMTKVRRAHNKLRIHLMYNQINSMKGQSANNKQDHKPGKAPKTRLPESNFTENEYMANYEGYWVSRSQIGHLNRIRGWKADRIIKERKDGNTSMDLTNEETNIINRQMKKEKRREHDFLCQKIKNNEIPSLLDDDTEAFPPNSNNEADYQTHKNDSFMDTNKSFKGRSKMVQFDGFSVTKESAERLTYLKDELANKNFSESEISETIKLERRKDERDLKKVKKLICFNCREPGHTVAQCRKTKTAEVCFKCGSTEHMSRNCSRQGSFTHAQCFYCKKTGHLARECSENPNGLYPDGGCCRECGSNKHLVKDCPTIMEKRSGSGPTLKMMRAGDNPEDMDF